jgi:hypothetical protein
MPNGACAQRKQLERRRPDLPNPDVGRGIFALAWLVARMRGPRVQWEVTVGSPVRFRCTRGDLGDLDRQIGRVGLAVVCVRPPAAEAVVFESLSAADSAGMSVALVRPDDIARIQWRHFDGQDVWVPEHRDELLIDYMPGFHSDGSPRDRHPHHAGRFWLQTSWWDSAGNKVAQSAELLSAGRKLMGWIRRNWVLVDADYESPSAHEFLESKAAANAWRDQWRVVLDEPASDAAAQIDQWRSEYRERRALHDEDVRVKISGPWEGAPGRIVIEVRDRPQGTA